MLDYYWNLSSGGADYKELSVTRLPPEAILTGQDYYGSHNGLPFDFSDSCENYRGRGIELRFAFLNQISNRLFQPKGRVIQLLLPLAELTHTRSNTLLLVKTCFTYVSLHE
jgi:hypothetical protein